MTMGYAETYRRSLERPEEFWAEAAEAVEWERRWEQRGRPGTLTQFYEALARDSGVPAGRIAEADELAALVAFLVSPHAAYITGVAINFDGGLSGVV